MPILNVSSLGVGSLTNLCFHSQNIANDSITSSCSLSYVSYNFTNNNNINLLNLYRKSGINRYPIQAAPTNASSEAQIDENLDDSTLSLEPPRPIRRPADWEAAKKYKETGSIYEGRVEGFNNGGLLIRFYSLVGFLPFPQLSPSYSSEEPNKTIQQIARGLIGSVIYMKVIEVDEDSKKLIFSEKEATWSKYSEKIKEGDIFEARVGVVEDYGAFLNLRFPDGKYHLTGLVHVSEVSWDYVQDVRDVLRVGDVVRVKIVNIDREKSRITLSIRQLEEDPLFETLDKVIPQDGTSPDSTGTSENFDIQPLPGLEEIFKELLEEEGISDVRIRRQGFEKRVVSQDLQLWLSNAPAIDNQYILLARAGRQVQEIQMTTSLDQEGIKKALQRVLERVP
ncbi:uncharacterized protein LOC110714804 [Chenopodium quinoa]|uniref:S1 motif domain-containing protein n=1 Tax=Chenopodium quinoa TaxID=63459 RepID=A0A803LZK6_CHEQI|nr:uncharacterized protein LOC110714804 [Chenopodium quinoa]